MAATTDEVYVQGVKTRRIRDVHSGTYPLPTPEPTPMPTVEAVDCVVSDWGLFSDCTQACGGGYMWRNRTIIPAKNGGYCPVNESYVLEEALCNTHDCPLDCRLEEWGDWSACSAECAGGAHTRKRGVIEYDAYGGVECGNTTETLPCNLFPCPTPAPTPLPTPAPTSSPFFATCSQDRSDL